MIYINEVTKRSDLEVCLINKYIPLKGVNKTLEIDQIVKGYTYLFHEGFKNVPTCDDYPILVYTGRVFHRCTSGRMSQSFSF